MQIAATHQMCRRIFGTIVVPFVLYQYHLNLIQIMIPFKCNKLAAKIVLRVQAAVYDMLLVAITPYLALRSKILLPRNRST